MGSQGLALKFFSCAVLQRLEKFGYTSVCLLALVLEHIGHLEWLGCLIERCPSPNPEFSTTALPDLTGIENSKAVLTPLCHNVSLPAIVILNPDTGVGCQRLPFPWIWALTARYMLGCFSLVDMDIHFGDQIPTVFYLKSTVQKG